MRTLSAYRNAQETLRCAPPASDLASAQIAVAAERAGVDQGTIAALVGTWMEQEPLSVLPGCLRPGLVELLEQARRAGLRLGVLSDYPAEAKLDALGVASLFEAVVSSGDSQVQRFKPDPRGLEVIAQRLGVDCGHTIYIGDRPEIDATAASRAGMGSFIIHGRRPFPGLSQLISETEPARAVRKSSRQTEDVPA